MGVNKCEESASVLQVGQGQHDLWPPQRKVLEVIIFLLSSIAATMARIMATRARKGSGVEGRGC